MSWTSYFDKIFLINLPKRTDRLRSATHDLSLYKIPFEIVPAINHKNGAKGLFLTMKAIFEMAIDEQYKNILLFEDDAKFINDPNKYMPLCLEQLGRICAGYDIFHLGPNTHQPLQRHSDNLLRMHKCRATHAVAYSAQGIELILRKLSEIPFHDHIDVYFENHIQPLGGCYCSYPMIATQHNDYSDITKSEADQSYIEKRFLENTEHMLPSL